MNFFHNLERFAGNTALVEQSGRTISYGELAAQADVFAFRLGPERQLVAIDCRNNIDTVIGYLGTLRAGHVAMLVDSELDTGLRNNLLSRYSAGFRWSDVDNHAAGHNLQQLNPRSPLLHRDLALLLSTSGSTGSPKLVRLTQRNLTSNAESIVNYLSLNEDERPITTLPLHYSYGLSILNSHLSVGGTVLLTNEPVTSRKFWDFFHHGKATSFGGVPYTYEILRRLRFDRMDLSSLRYFTQAGGKLNQDLVSYFSAAASNKNVKFIIMYGQTEATARISYLPGDLIADFGNSIGQPIPGGELWLEDEKGNRIVQTNRIGELIYQGPNVMMGYASSEQELQSGDECRGILKTGDLAYFDENGLFYIAGRTKRFIKLFGNRVSLDEVETYLKSMNIECAVTGRDNALLVVYPVGVPSTTTDLLKEKYRFHPSIIKSVHVDRLPVNSAGKIQYSELLTRYLPN